MNHRFYSTHSYQQSLNNQFNIRWLSTLFPSIIFWSGGFVVFVEIFGWKELISAYSDLSQNLQFLLLFSGLLLITISAIFVSLFDSISLRLLEGYWPNWMSLFQKVLIIKQKNNKDKDYKQWQNLISNYTSSNNILDRKEVERIKTLDWRLTHTPSKKEDLMPTTLGNILKSAESRSHEKYGLDIYICWPRFWLVLPAFTKETIQRARVNLYSAVRVCVWSILFCLWGLWVWWTIPIGLFFARLAYMWAIQAAKIYSDTLESIFDVHRYELYKSLRWPLPKNPSTERQEGKLLMAFLWRGYAIDNQVFSDDI